MRSVGGEFMDPAFGPAKYKRPCRNYSRGNTCDVHLYCRRLDEPSIRQPGWNGHARLCLRDRRVCHNQEGLVQGGTEGYRGWNLEIYGLFLVHEIFIQESVTINVKPSYPEAACNLDEFNTYVWLLDAYKHFNISRHALSTYICIKIIYTYNLEMISCDKLHCLNSRTLSEKYTAIQHEIMTPLSINRPINTHSFSINYRYLN